MLVRQEHQLDYLSSLLFSFYFAKNPTEKISIECFSKSPHWLFLGGYTRGLLLLSYCAMKSQLVETL